MHARENGARCNVDSNEAVQGKYGNLDASVISYGPCQTPTLTFAVQRHQIVTAFQPEDFWSVRPHISKAGQKCALLLLQAAADGTALEHRERLVPSMRRCQHWLPLHSSRAPQQHT